MRTYRLLTVLAALAITGFASACYRVAVVTGASPSATVVDRPWAHSFVYGLVPPPAVDVSQSCPAGVSRVVTQRSFLNGLVQSFTWGIYTPMQITATCASGSRSSSLGLPAPVLGMSEAAHTGPVPAAPAVPALVTGAAAPGALTAPGSP